MKYSKIIFSVLCTVILFIFSPQSLLNAAEVYLVIGSDTAIWDGMSVSRFHCYYNPDLYINPAANAYRVMDPAFRAQFKDSYGQPLKMTWWMMAGNIFRYADNKNVPLPNIMTLYLMKKYHGDQALINGDEISLHYHTFFWSDYNGDGLYYWNQAKSFNESFDDFNVTLAQFLLEEKVFPVSFRSGWHYMDNDWQRYLDQRVLPYSLHNDYPAKRTDTSEPLDNTFDWSLAPKAFVPYHPSRQNYQIPGNGPGWDVRSASFSKTISLSLMDSIFEAAHQGQDQVACLWSHLPQSDFLDQIEIIDSLAQKNAQQYPDVKFRYCTAIEAMQRWQKSSDKQAPQVTFTEESSAGQVTFTIETDGPIFQEQPFVAVKDIYENYRVLSCVSAGSNRWQTTEPVPEKDLAKAGVAVCDSVGNQTLAFINYLPDDLFIDNQDAGYAENYGNWSTSTNKAWGTDSRSAVLSAGDSASAQWSCTVNQTAWFNIFVQLPLISNPADEILFIIYRNQQAIDTVTFHASPLMKDWVYLSTIEAEAQAEIRIEMKASGTGQAGKILAADVVKITALVKDKDLYVRENFVNFGPVAQEDTTEQTLEIFNRGITDLHIQKITSVKKMVFSSADLPLTVPAMGKIELPLFFYITEAGNKTDTLIISSDDPAEPQKRLPVYGDGRNYFTIVDNEDQGQYKESGEWHTSVAQAYGSSSRYAWLNANPGAWAEFSAKLKKSGVYEIFEIVPKTVNSTDRALYEFRIQGVAVDSVFVDQNQGSGGWVSLGRHYIPADIEAQVRVIDTGESSVGAVLRADAVQFALIEEITDLEKNEFDGLPRRFRLSQNYPNPFNSTTVIEFQIPSSQFVSLKIYNMLGQKVATLISQKQAAGDYRYHWRPMDLASGVYYCRLRAGKKFVQVRKMLYVK